MMGPLALTSAAFYPSIAACSAHAVLTSPPVAGAAAYWVGANALYLARRSHLRQMSMTRLFKIRTTREHGVSWPLYVTIILVWQAFVLVFPLAESAAYSFRRVSFFYSYPRANGCGIILEPCDVQHLGQSQRAKHQIRMDWHRFSVNIGNVGREGYRHPPSIQRNLPHLDIPQKGMKHWPWRRRKIYMNPKGGTKVD